MKGRTRALALLVACAAAGTARAQEAAPARAPLLSRWAADVRPDRVHPEHPRPYARRATWQTLNGPWSYAIRPRAAERPADWDGSILVPFPVESHLSGVGRGLSPDERLWYRRTFRVPDGWAGRRVLLHFEAVDWRAEVWVNGRAAGRHEGGYDAFTLDVTALLTGTGQEAGALDQELVVAAWDPTDTGDQPRGKQVLEPRGIWYTPSSGIWRTVWLEGVPETAVHGASVRELGGSRVALTPESSGLARGQRIEAVVALAGRELARGSSDGGPLELDLGALRHWSPDDPALYDLRLRVLDGEREVDALDSYFALRTVEVRPDADGIPRIHLNGRVLFQLGLLDQGFWPGGLYTAPTDEALRYDLEVTRRLGFNLVRKHVKVEPERWYYHCDRLGLLVWQDLPSGGPYIGPSDPDAQRSAESAADFEREAAAIVAGLRHHPCIVSWVLFNEGWGQYDTARLAAWLAELDPARFVNSASGWTDRGVGQVYDVHSYPGPAMPPVEDERVAVLGEFGGLGLALPGHTWQEQENWGYRNHASQAELVDAYVALVPRLRPLIRRGLAAAVYTQTTDVEIEVNGVMTYDRAVAKLDDPRVVAVNRAVYLPPPRIERLVPTSREKPRTWRYTRAAPAVGWTAAGFDDSAWESGPGGFGTAGTPGAVVGTTWSAPEIWLRRRFELPALPVLGDDGWLTLVVHHDEDAEVWLNGVRIASLSGYTTDYDHIWLEDEQLALLVAGTNTLAVQCRQTTGGQFIDVGLCILRERR